MKLARPILILSILVLLSASLLAQSGPSPSDEGQRFRKGEVIVEVSPGVSIDSINARYGTSTLRRLYSTNFYLLETKKRKKEKKWRKRLAKDPDVLSAALNPVITTPSLFARSTQSFPEGYATIGLTHEDYLSQQELFSLLQLQELNTRSRGRGVVIAVVDTGVDSFHPSLSAKLWTDGRQGGEVENDQIDNDGDGLIDDFRGWDFVENDNDPNERADDPSTTIAGHGTFIAGIITMLAPESHIMPVRAFGPDGIGDAFSVASAIKYAADHGADVINLSLGSPEESELLAAAIRDARARGTLLVAAVGNDGSEVPPQYPSSDEDVIAVAALELTGHRAPFSNFGLHVDVAAPGSGLISTYPGSREGAFALWSGTSFAAPFVAAEAALVLEVDPTTSDVKKSIEDTAINIDNLNPGHAGKLGKGRIDPLRALISVNAPSLDGTSADYYSRIELIRSTVTADARGTASVSINGTRQTLSVEASNLLVRNTEYKLLVNGALVATAPVFASNLGSVQFVFSTASTPPPVLPVTSIRLIELRDGANRVVLTGEFREESVPTDLARRAYKQARLVPAVSAPNGFGGSAVAKIEGSREELRVRAEGLAPGATYSIIVDGIGLGFLTASASGFLGAILTNDGSGAPLPPALRPVTRVRRIEVFDGRTQLVLRGEFTAVNLSTRSL